MFPPCDPNREPSANEKTVFQLSLLANKVTTPAHGHPERDLLAIIEKALHTEPGLENWELVWGPTVVVEPTTAFPINSMYMAREKGTNNYVVAIAGTNPISLFDWFVEDFLVLPEFQVPWVFGGSDAKISLGTAIGLGILLSMKPTVGLQRNSTLMSYLGTLTGEPINVTVTGHSLGGALSPSYALFLQDTKIVWDFANNATISVEPTAGATPGNRAFANYYDDKLGERTARFYNDLDIVPHAWELSDLAQIPNLYEPDIKPGAIVDKLAKCAIKTATGGDYVQLLQKVPPFCSQVDTTRIKDWPLPSDWSDFLNFLIQAAYQHVNQYKSYFGVPPDDAQVEDDPSKLLTPAIRRALRQAGVEMPEALVSAEALPEATVPIDGKIICPKETPANEVVQEATEALRKFVPKK